MNTILASTSRYLRLAFGKTDVGSQSQRRYVRIIQGMLTGLAGKGVAAIVGLISVPLTVRYLGAERYGAWITISTVMSWIALADLGTSNSLTNAISEAYANNRRDLAQEYAASALWLQAAVMAFLAAIFFGVWRFIQWDQVLNVQSVQARLEVAPAVGVAFAIFVVNFPLTTISRIYAGHQEVAIANAWSALANILALAALVLVTRSHGGLVSLVIAVSGSVLLVNATSAVWMFGWSKPWLAPRIRCVTRSAVKKIGGLGGMFFLVQLAGVALFQTDNLIIAHFLGASAVTPYSVTWRLFNYTTIFQMLALPSYWPAYSEAFSRGDRAWIRRTFRVNLVISVATTAILSAPLILAGRWIIERWAGSAAVPSVALLFWMGLWSIISAAMNSQACVLASAGRLRGQIVYSLAAAVLNLTLTILLVRRMELVGVILGTIIAYVACIVAPQSFEVRRAIAAQDQSQMMLRTQS